MWGDDSHYPPGAEKSPWSRATLGKAAHIGMDFYTLVKVQNYEGARKAFDAMLDLLEVRDET